MITRRSLVSGLSAFIAAPAIIRVADLMPVRVWANETEQQVIAESMVFGSDRSVSMYLKSFEIPHDTRSKWRMSITWREPS